MKTGAEGNCAESTRNDEEETTNVSAEDRSHDEIAATTPTGLSAAGLSQTPNDGDASIQTSADENIAKENNEQETRNASERTETNTVNDTTASEEVQGLNDDEGAILSSGDTDGGNAKEKNACETNEVPAPPDNINEGKNSPQSFDLLGSSQAETMNPSSNVSEVFEKPLDDQNKSAEKVTGATVDPESIHGFSGMTSGQNVSSNDVQQQSPGPDPTNFKPHHPPTERKEDVGKCTNADSQEISPVINTAGKEKQESISESKDCEVEANQSKQENSVTAVEGNSVVEEHTSPSAEKEGNGPSVVSPNEDAPVTNAASIENKESTSENSVIVEGANQSEIESVGTNESILVAEEQTNKASSSSEQGEQELKQVESDIDSPLGAISQNGVEKKERINNDADDNASTGNVNGEVEEHTEEEEEWLSMGLGLGDALRQIVALTEERESALAVCQEKEALKVEGEAILAEVSSRLGEEMNLRAEAESEVLYVRGTLNSYKEQLATYEKMEDNLEQAQANLVMVVSQKSKIELEVAKLRELRDQSQQNEVVLSNRLNAAKKKEANKSTAAGRLEADNENLMDDLQRTRDELESTSRAKAKLESNMAKLKAKAVERVRQAETALSEERELNEERKRKMKVFVETKADGLREAKESANDTQKELEETRASLRSSRDREEAVQKELEMARLKYRESQRDMERTKRNSEQLHRMGNNLEQELEKSENETQEHKKKRMSAKHEIMQMVRTLEAERSVSSKLRESVKFTFTPKALSQQELLNECLRDFQVELERLAAKMGKTLLPSSESSEQAPAGAGGAKTSEINGSSRKLRKTRASKVDMDTERLVSNLEQETQHVSKGIMALGGSIERMRSVLDEGYGCMTFFSNVIAGSGEAQHQRLSDGDAREENSSDQFV